MIFYSLLFLVFLSPLPFGVNRPWSWSLWALLVAILAIAWSITSLISKPKSHFFRHFKSIRDIVLVFSLVVIWALIQTSSHIPSDWGHPVWGMMNETLSLNINPTISLTPADTITLLMRLLSYALVFWLTLCYCQDRDKTKIVFWGLLVSGFVYSIYGLVIDFGQIKTFLWHELQGGSLTSTFVNRNHFATYAGLTLLCTLALLNSEIKTSSHYRSGGYIGLQRFMEALITRTWFPLLAFFVIGTALILTNSRGGFLSSTLAIVVLLFVLNFKHHSRNIYVLIFAGLLVVFGGLIFYFSSEPLFSRFDLMSRNNIIRDKVYAQVWLAITNNPWLGFGYGSFEEAFPLYKNMEIAGSIKSPILWNYAHNTYLETIFELGFPAALGLFYCIFRLAWICFQGLRTRKRDLIYPATGLAATVLIAIHSLVDFSMQIPAVAYTYAMLMGAACAQSFSSRDKQS